MGTHNHRRYETFENAFAPIIGPFLRGIIAARSADFALTEKLRQSLCQLKYSLRQITNHEGGDPFRGC